MSYPIGSKHRIRMNYLPEMVVITVIGYVKPNVIMPQDAYMIMQVYIEHPTYNCPSPKLLRDANNVIFKQTDMFMTLFSN